jgi:hypothetical protein
LIGTLSFCCVLWVFWLWHFVKHFADFILLSCTEVYNDGFIVCLQPTNNEDVARKYTQQYAESTTPEITKNTSDLIY